MPWEAPLDFVLDLDLDLNLDVWEAGARFPRPDLFLASLAEPFPFFLFFEFLANRVFFEGLPDFLFLASFALRFPGPGCFSEP